MASMPLILDGSLRPYPESPASEAPLTEEVESVSQHRAICFSHWSEAEGMAAYPERRPRRMAV